MPMVRMVALSVEVHRRAVSFTTDPSNTLIQLEPIRTAAPELLMGLGLRSPRSALILLAAVQTKIVGPLAGH
jgi:hypothetical protein